MVALRTKTDQRTYNNYLKERLQISPHMQTDKLGLKNGGVNFVMAMPDTPYGFWRSAGMHIVANEAAKVGCNIDFCYLPFPNVIEDARKEGLKTLFSNSSVGSADILALSISNPSLIFNTFELLKLSGIEFSRLSRRKPLVVAGHLGISNPAPFEDYIDAFVIGDGDDAIKEIVSVFKQHEIKEQMYKNLAEIEGVYVPDLTERKYGHSGTLEDVIYRGHDKVRQRILSNLKDYRRASLMVKDEAFVFMDYSCKYKCGFCQMSNLRGKYRPNAVDEIKRYLAEYDEMGVKDAVLAGASSTNYPKEGLAEIFSWAKENLKATRPIIRSVRIDDIEKIAPYLTQEYLHIAPETGTDSLRNKVLMKSIKNEEIMNNLETEITEKGIHDIRTYFIVGVPSETENDRMEYAGMLKVAAKEMDRCHGKGTIRVDMYPLMPQPGTPFEGFGTLGLAAFAKIREEFEKSVRSGLPDTVEFKLNPLNPLPHLLEALLNTGDKKSGELALRAYENGAGIESLKQECNSAGIPYEQHVPRGNWHTKPWNMIEFVNSKYLDRQKLALLQGLADRNI
ncbi:MAG: radical SAM protein [Candidatus Woesearchaeota archaeon]